MVSIVDDGGCRVQFDATVDEMVDAGMRLATRTRSYRVQRVRTMVIAGGCLSAAMLGSVFVGNSQRAVERSAAAWTIMVAVALALGVGFGYSYGMYLNWGTRRHYRRIVAEQLGEIDEVRVEIELGREGARVAQKGNEMMFAWSNAAGVVDTVDAIELRFNPGLVVVRNRAFQDEAQRVRFLERARALSHEVTGKTEMN